RRRGRNSGGDAARTVGRSDGPWYHTSRGRCAPAWTAGAAGTAGPDVGARGRRATRLRRARHRSRAERAGHAAEGASGAGQPAAVPDTVALANSPGIPQAPALTGC